MEMYFSRKDFFSLSFHCSFIYKVTKRSHLKPSFMTEDNLGASELTVGSGIIENHEGRATRGCEKESKEDA